MEAKIKEIQVKFIECGKCGFEESCRLSKDQKVGDFIWNCSNCGQCWTGSIDKYGAVFVEMNESSESDYSILVKLPKNLTPFALIGERTETAEEAIKRDLGKNYTTSETLSLRRCEPVDAMNAQAFPEYEAILF